MAEPAEEAYRENAREEGDVEPRGRAAPIDVAEIAEDRNKLQDCEGDVASRQGPDPEEIVLAARMKRREADSDEPRSDGPGGQRREYPRPSPLDGVRGEEESDANREHADTLTEDQKPHPCRSGGSARWIDSRCAELEDPVYHHRDWHDGVDRRPVRRCVYRARRLFRNS